MSRAWKASGESVVIMKVGEAHGLGDGLHVQLHGVALPSAVLAIVREAGGLEGTKRKRVREYYL